MPVYTPSELAEFAVIEANFRSDAQWYRKAIAALWPLREGFPHPSGRVIRDLIGQARYADEIGQPVTDAE